ncbi:MAG: hypothetical protein ABI613_11240, partial [Gemmatimonadota bacterium]
WWLSWEGDSLLLAGRPHPLGLVMEVRGMGWNGPGANEDILYFLVTYYNITSSIQADYANAPAALQPILLRQAQEFRQKSEARFGVSLPAGGYTISSMYAGMFADPDIPDASSNYASVNLPLSTSLAWQNKFQKLFYFDAAPEIFSPPFFTGPGLAGIKFLNAPNQAAGANALASFSDITGSSGTLEPPVNVAQLYRYFNLTPDPLQGDQTCASPGTRICSVIQTALDIRQFQATGPFILKAGESATSALAYLFAAPYRTGGISSCPACDIKPGSFAIISGLSNPSVVSGGVNPIDSIAGFLGASDLSGDGILQGDEFLAAPRTFYAKAQIAQAMFDNHFLVPSAPTAPDFFLIPGDGQVTVLWRPSATEQTGDAYFTIAHNAQVVNATGTLVPNPLYDPNFRQFDVEGYRIYRGRVNAGSSLTLLAQFDYAGTVISDYQAQVNPNRFCAPEAGVTSQCDITYDPVFPGQARTAHVDVPLVGRITQVQLGDRIVLPDGSGLELRTDTLATDLNDTGVPFTYIDKTVRNNFRYFYSVVAFDVNSRQSGPSSFESVRVLKTVSPVRPASNFDNAAGTRRVELFGRGTVLDSATPFPSIDPVSGRFSGPFPPATQRASLFGWSLNFSVFLANTLTGSGSISVRLDSIQLGSPYDNLPHRYWWTATSSSSATRTVFSVPVMQTQEFGFSAGSTAFTAVEIDPALAARFGGGPGFGLQGRLELALPGPDYETLYGRGCVNRRVGFDGSSAGCAYNGSRWFDGPSPANNETFADPNQGNPANTGSPGSINPVGFTNAGHLTGVVSILNTMAYETAIGSEYRNVEGIKAGAHRAADFNVYWGSAGKIDSVIDVTHNVVVPFDSTMGGTWGILNQNDAQPFTGSRDARTELSNTDMGCVEPLRSYVTVISCGPSGPLYRLSQTAVPGSVVIFGQSTAASQTDPPAANTGFILYLAGDWFTFELQGGVLPPSGRVWTLRQYVGAIQGGTGAAGSLGAYSYTLPEAVLPLTSVGVEARLSYDVVNQVNAPTNHDLSAVHTVPDPYYLTNSFEGEAGSQVIKFVNLPVDAVIRIYSSSGVLVKLLEHHSPTFGGAEDWDVRNRTGRRVSSGVYFYHIEAGNARRAGRFTIVNDRPGF